MQRPDIGDDIAPGGDLDLHPQPGEDARHIGDGLLQRQILAQDAGTRLRAGCREQQCLGIGIQVVHFLDHEFRPGLHHFLYRAALDRTQDALAVLVRNIRRQLDLDLEDLFVAVLRVDNVVLRQADIIGGDIARAAVQLHEIRCAQGRGGQEVIERPRRRAVALVADGLIGHHREVIELRFEAKVVEKVDLDFHGTITGLWAGDEAAIIRFLRGKSCTEHLGGAPFIEESPAAAVRGPRAVLLDYMR